MNVVSAREFNQDLSGAKRMAERGPVIVTDRGQPSHVLLSFEDYERLSRSSVEDFLEAMVCDAELDVELMRPRFEVPEF